MTQKEVVETLLAQAKIEPGFTELVPQNCAPENTGKARKQESLQHLMGSSLPNVFSNSSSSLYIGTHASIELPTHASRNHAPSAMLSTQNSNMGLMQEINGKMLKSAAGFSRSSAYMFGAESSLLETRPTIGDTAFNSAEPSTQSLNEPLPDADISSFGLLGQISLNFNLSDLTADFSPSSGPTAALGKQRSSLTMIGWFEDWKTVNLLLSWNLCGTVVLNASYDNLIDRYLESSHQNLFLVVVATEMALAPPPSTFDQLHNAFGTVFWTLLVA
ncbi:hypothetical protein GOBAR_AA03500 [Gossypium barbadense]|uniref:Uncharacterized protein n=1 Tax=Gossypium barbadense TaxID=3634 RepID=A0A2P5YNB0_GOSBA|nr:hypothetical protein GOBAR_AA03500 [Gossypium barbadense]